MALAASETWQGGFVRDSSEALVAVTSTAAAEYRGGFLRDADGRLVLSYV